MKIKPGQILFVLFGLLSCFLFLIIMYWFSLPFFNLFGLEVTLYIFLPLLLNLLITIFIDRKYKTKLKPYSLLALGIFLFCLVIFPSTKEWIIKNTESKGNILVKGIKDYKLKYGFYPKSLADPYFDNYSKKAIINRPFVYELYQNNKMDTTFVITCYSFDGYIAKRYPGNKDWLYSD